MSKPYVTKIVVCPTCKKEFGRRVFKKGKKEQSTVKQYTDHCPFCKQEVKYEL